MNKLYPLKFKPLLKDKIWGGTRLKNTLHKSDASGKAGESWEISGVQGDISIVANGFLKSNNLQELIEVYMGDLVGDKVYSKFGLEFPLLIKFIDASDILSIQVHPDDKLAKERHNSYGKTEMWYIIDAEPGSEITVGFKGTVDREIYLDHLGKKKLNEILNIEKTSPGDVFFLPAGRVHAIGKGVLLAEIQQTSDITYRIYDFDRRDDKGNLRELHTDLALDAIDFKSYPEYKTEYSHKLNETSPIIKCNYFTTNLLEFDAPVEKNFNLIDTFIIYMCLSGDVEIEYGPNEKVSLKTGETVLVPASIELFKLIPVSKSKVLEVYIE